MKKIRTWCMALASVFALAMPVRGATAPDWKQVTQPDTIVGYYTVSNIETKALVEADGSKLAVFAANGECRGVANVIDGPKSRLFSLSIGIASPTEKGLTLKCWDAATLTTFDVNDYTLDASIAGEQVGRIVEPVVVTVGVEPVVVTHAVMFDLGEYGTRTGGGELTQTIDDGAAATAPTVEANDGWTFTGWDKTFDNVTADLTVTAQYEAVAPLDVYENLNEAKSAAIREGKLIFLLSGATWCGYTLKLQQYIKDAGSVFSDNYVYLWHDQDEDAFGIAETSTIPEFWIFSPNDLDLASKSSWDDVALYVCEGCPTQYDSFLDIINTYADLKPDPLPLAKIHFNVNDGWFHNGASALILNSASYPATGTMADQNYVVGQDVVLTQNKFERKGFTFGGWATAANFGVLYKDGDTVRASDLPEDEEGFELFAVWYANTINVTFNRGPFSDTTEPTTVKYVVGTVYHDFPIHTRTGWDVRGWYTQPTGGDRYQAGDVLPFTEDGTLYLQADYVGDDDPEQDPDPEPETNLTFTAEITGIALVADYGDYDPSELTFVDPSTPLTVPYGAGVIFRVNYDYPDGYSATVWTLDRYEDDDDSYAWYFFSNPSAYYEGKGEAYGFLALRDDIKCPTVDLKAVAVRAGFSPVPEGFADEMDLSQVSVNLTFKGGTPANDESTAYPAGEACEIEAPETTLTGTIKWSAKNLPKGLKIDSKTGIISGTPTAPGTYVAKVTAKSGTASETFDVEIVVGNYVDELLPLEDGYDAQVGVKTLIELGEDFVGAKASGLPSGLKFAAKDVTDKEFGDLAAGTIYGVPSKAATNCVIFTIKEGTATHTASAMFAVAAAPTWSVGTFNGRLDDGSGSATMTVAASGKISGKIITGGKTWSFSSSGYDEDPDHVTDRRVITATAKSGKLTAEVSITVGDGDVTGSIAGDEIDAAITLWRNEWKDKGATDKLKDWAGLYTVQLEGGDIGTGYLSLTLDAKGNCKATGKLPDGTSASGSLPLVWDAETEAPMAIWQLAPSAYKGGYVGGLLVWTTGDAESEEVDAESLRVTGDGIAWTSHAPTATAEYGEGFELTLTASGAYYNKLAALSDYYATLAFCADAPALDVTVKTTDYDENDKKATTSEQTEIGATEPGCWSALTISLDTKGTAFVVDQGKATKPVKVDGEWTYDGDNDAALTFSFAKATGIFKGTFTCWYDYVSATDYTKDPEKETLVHTSKKVSYEGVMVLGESLRGFYLWDRTGTYEDEKTGKEKTFKYKESRMVEFQVVD